MTNLQIDELIEKLKEKGVRFEKGLTQEEVVRIQEKFELKFPPDLKQFLQTVLPVSQGFYDWRQALKSDAVAGEIKTRLRWPLEGMLFDIKENKFWVESWGQKPELMEEQFLVAEMHYKTYPKLIPVYSHRYMPAEPGIPDNPVLSVYQMDIIYYGYNLASYFADEFRFTLSDHFEELEEPKHDIEFWTWCVENNC